MTPNRGSTFTLAGRKISPTSGNSLLRIILSLPEKYARTFSMRSADLYLSRTKVLGRPDLTSRPLQFQTIRDYLVAYAPYETPLLVIAVPDGWRNPRIIAAAPRERRWPQEKNFDERAIRCQGDPSRVVIADAQLKAAMASSVGIPGHRTAKAGSSKNRRAVCRAGFWSSRCCRDRPHNPL
jgi:hypothetical protein